MIAMPKSRMTFVPEMQDFIVRNLLAQHPPFLTENLIRRALDQWNAGVEFTDKLDPLDYALFESFSKVQEAVEKG
jgi:hypothetical protein